MNKIEKNHEILFIRRNIEEITSSENDQIIRNELRRFKLKSRKNSELEEEGMPLYFHEQLNPLLTMWRLMCVFPVNVPIKGPQTFRIFLISWLYTLAVYTVIIARSFMNAERIIQHLEKQTFLMTTYFYIILMFNIPYPFIPLMLWSQMTKITNYFKKWIEFQDFYLKVTRKHLDLALKRRVVISMILHCIATASVFILVYIPPYERAWNIYPYYFNTLFFNSFCSFWVITCISLQIAGKEICIQLKNELHDLENPKIIGDYRILWFRLSQLTRLTGSTLCRSFIMIFLFEFVMLTLTLYGFLAGIRTEDRIMLSGLILTCTLSAIALFVLCNAAHHTTERIQEIQYELENIKFSDPQEKTAHEVCLFLNTIARNPIELSLGGFAVVNRGLFKSFICLIASYLIVLVQFGSNVSSLDCKEQLNTTHVTSK